MCIVRSSRMSICASRLDHGCQCKTCWLFTRKKTYIIPALLLQFRPAHHPFRGRIQSCCLNHTLEKRSLELAAAQLPDSFLVDCIEITAFFLYSRKFRQFSLWISNKKTSAQLTLQSQNLHQSSFHTRHFFVVSQVVYFTDFVQLSAIT